MTAGSSAPTNISSQLAVLSARIEAQGQTLNRLESSLSNIEKRIADSEASRNNFTVAYERTNAVLEGKTDAAHRRIDEHVSADLPKWAEVDALVKEVASLRDMVLAQQQTNRMIAWFTGIVGSSVILWLMSNILGLIK